MADFRDAGNWVAASLELLFDRFRLFHFFVSRQELPLRHVVGVQLSRDSLFVAVSEMGSIFQF